MKCSICQGRIPIDADGWKGGHNAQPVNDGRCCGACNESVVISARLTQFALRNKGTENADA